MNINDGEGLWDKYGLLRSCIQDLSGLRIRVDELDTNGILVVDIINRLSTLIDGLKKDDERTQHELDELRKQLEEEETEEDG